MVKGKLSTRYEIQKQVKKVSNDWKSPSGLALVHPVFHFSILTKCIVDPVSILLIKGLEVNENLSYQEVLVEILNRQLKRLRNKEVTSVKVL